MTTGVEIDPPNNSQIDKRDSEPPKVFCANCQSQIKEGYQQPSGRTHNKKHWLDYAGLIVACIAFVATSISGGFAFFQGWVANDTEKRSLRAYVAVDGKFSEAQQGFQLRAIHANGPLDGWIAINNSGDTPAYKMKLWMYTKADIYPVQKTMNFQTELIANGIYLGRHAQTFASKSSPSIGPADWIEIFKKRKAIYVYGTIYYKDAFRTLRHTSFCNAFTGPQLESDDCGIPPDIN